MGWRRLPAKPSVRRWVLRSNGECWMHARRLPHGVRHSSCPRRALAGRERICGGTSHHGFGLRSHDLPRVWRASFICRACPPATTYSESSQEGDIASSACHRHRRPPPPPLSPPRPLLPRPRPHHVPRPRRCHRCCHASSISDKQSARDATVQVGILV